MQGDVIFDCKSYWPTIKSEKAIPIIHTTYVCQMSVLLWINRINPINIKSTHSALYLPEISHLMSKVKNDIARQFFNYLNFRTKTRYFLYCDFRRKSSNILLRFLKGFLYAMVR